jgi:hypothetical protein
VIHIVYSAPCVYDRKQRGFAEAEIGYTGEYPVTTAERYLLQIPGARLYSAVKDGVDYTTHVWD